VNIYIDVYDRRLKSGTYYRDDIRQINEVAEMAPCAVRKVNEDKWHSRELGPHKKSK